MFTAALFSSTSDNVSASTGSASFQDPFLVALWIAVGFVGLVAGVVTVTVAERRLRRANAAPATVAPALTTESGLITTV